MFKNITLEMSLKPFKQTDDEYIREVCRKAFEQWRPLIKDADIVSVLLWTADGSELLDYSGNLDDEFDWANLCGVANRPKFSQEKHDPEGVSLQFFPKYYMENPPKMTYGVLKKIVSKIKTVGHTLMPDKNICVGTTFDPGGELSKSDFKYKRHNEICLGGDMGGAGSTVCSYATLHADDVHYAAYPNGIPEGLPLGTFLGKQAQIFMTDMGFDYIWFSNGFGFGRDPWSTTGAVFDGERFDCENVDRIKGIAMDFWKLFREGCPDFSIQNRGTNMSTGIDFSTEAIPLKDIYDGGFNILPPPNIPTSALHYDVGIELMGHMSRIAELPGDEYMFRYYLHDLWYINSPWKSRYNGEPYDIYMPMALSRIDENGQVQSPTHFNILSIDDSFGDFPEDCADQSLPHILKAEEDVPDKPSPLVWVYPFREYCSCKNDTLAKEMFFGDWFIRNAINLGLPLSTVVSTDNFIKHDKEIYGSSILLSTVPEAGSDYENSIIEYIENGGKVIFYGSTTRASDRFKSLVGVKQTDGISGELPLRVNGEAVGTLKHVSLISGGDIDTVATGGNGFAFVNDYTVATKGDNFVWLRGSNPNNFVKGARLLMPQDAENYYTADRLLFVALEHFGWSVKQHNKGGYNGVYGKYIKNNVIMLHRSNGAFIFSTFSNNTTSEVDIKMPLGAPVLDGYETYIENGYANYRFPKSEHKECRVFVEQESGVVSCKELPPTSAVYRRRFLVEGLKNATVRIFGEEYCKDNFSVLLNSNMDFHTISESFDGGFVKDGNDIYFEARNVTGRLTVSMPYTHFPPE